ncbi:hypothetical protein CEV32_3507 [Brucella rhizosphaerae]|uniref:Uncharacterized protein n=1 Tax=Brucella rhizosphaerae TaxID=571254 RepID=A0A256FSF6_9HYPH|nr:hypothetical protein CEV32_3507 [Brucella rhizosphaerae]
MFCLMVITILLLIFAPMARDEKSFVRQRKMVTSITPM